MRGLLFVLTKPRRFLALLGGFFATVLYVWFAAVRAVPGVKRRRAATRAARPWNA